MSPDGARRTVEDAERADPALRALAVLASLATRVEPAFLRMLRLELVPLADAGTEADLWFSPLVGAWSATGFVFEAGVAALLRAELVEEGRLEESWQVLQRAHAGAREATRRLDRLRYLGLRDGPGDRAEIEQTLGGLRSAIEQEEGHELARWIVQTFPSLPEPVRKTDDGALLALAAVTRVGGYPLELSGTFPPLPGRAFEVVPPGAGTRIVRFAVDGDELVFLSKEAEAPAPALEITVPGGAHPVVEVRSGAWSWTGEARANARIPLPPQAREVEVESLGGTVWTLRAAPPASPRKFFISYAPGFSPSAALESRFQAALTEAGHTVFRDTNMSLGSDWGAESTRRLNECDDFIVLLSEPALTSERVLEEVAHAFNRRRAGDTPRIWPVHVGSWRPLPYRWSFYLGTFGSRVCRDDGDFQSIVRDLIELPPGFVTPDPRVEAATAMPGPPEPSVDLAALAAPGRAPPPEDPFYIVREADARALSTADEGGVTLVIKAPHQMGKSSLLKHYLLRCRRAGRQTALVDLSLFPDHELRDYTAFLSHLASELLNGLGLDRTYASQVQTQPDLTYLIERQVLGAVEGPVVIAFDEVDRVLGRPYQASFFAMLRWWHEHRTDPGQEEAGWPRLDLALVISTEPYLLIDDALRSPFNVTAPIELSPFTSVECRELNSRYGHLLSNRDVDALYKLLGGQPYLTRLAYYHLGQGGTLDSLGRNPVEGPFSDHLTSLLMRLTRNPRSRDLLAAMKQVIGRKDAPRDAFERLAAAGLVRMLDGRMAPANELYRRFFRAVL